MKSFLLFLSFLFTSTLVFGQSDERKLLFIGIDGCRWDALQTANTPAIDQLLTTAKYSGEGLTEYKTWSGTGWSNMLTGVWHTKHNVTDNSFSNPNYTEYPDFISRLEANDPLLNTISVVHWAPINDEIIQYADHKVSTATDLAVKDSAVFYMNNNDTDILFVDFDDVDHAGHNVGYGTQFPAYVQSIETTDSYISEILQALYARPNYTNEDWLVIVTTDHGGNALGHGGGTIEERKIFHVFSNPQFDQEQWSSSTSANEVSASVITFADASMATPEDQTDFDFGNTQDFTIEMWVKANVFDGDPALISNKDWDSGLNEGFVISGQNDLYWKVNIGDGQDRLDIQGGELEAGAWHHLAVSCDRDGLMTAYEDGVVVGFEWMTAIGNINSGLPLNLHQDGAGNYGYSFNGSLRDVRIWNAAIPGDVIRDFALSQVNSSHPYYANLLANWMCDDGAGLTLLDSSPNANHAALSDAATWTWAESMSFEIYDYSLTPRQPDNAVTAMQWMCLEADPIWNLDGVGRLTNCVVDYTEEAAINSEFKCWPNPASERLNIQYQGKTAKGGAMRIIDAQGKLLYYSVDANTQKSIDVSTWPQGMYCAQYFGDEQKSLRFLIKH